jgi:hypothetical protein
VKIHNLQKKKKRTYCILLISHPCQLDLLLDNMPPNSVSKVMVKRSSHYHKTKIKKNKTKQKITKNKFGRQKSMQISTHYFCMNANFHTIKQIFR